VKNDIQRLGDYDSDMSQLTYQSAGVDLELYQQAMQKLPALMQRTHTPRVLDLPGGFAGLFRLDNSRRFAENYRDPILVSGTDGVGTKIKVAAMASKYDTVGIDLVAMCVNDCLCLGAEPLFLLDYLALGQDDPTLVGELVSGVSAGCVQAKAALLGGETAIMPDLYASGDFDMAGFCVGVVERKKLIDGRAIRPGDVVLGLASSGFHSNGYSLIRKVVFERARLGIDTYIPDLEQTVADLLLEPTCIYVRAITEILDYYHSKTVVRGMAHITGGGLEENIARILPPNRSVRIRRSGWNVPESFRWLMRIGEVDRSEMFRVFNMGIGFVLVVHPYYVESIQRQLNAHHIRSWVIGEVADGQRGVRIVG